MEKTMVKPLVTFRELMDGNMVAICGNHEAIAVNVDKVDEYMDKMLELTGGTDMEFNDTFRQICKDRVFYAFEQVDMFTPDMKPFVPEVVECVLLSNDSVAMNINGKIEICNTEEGDTLFKTKQEAEEAAKHVAFEANSKYLDVLCGLRKEIKDSLKRVSAIIDEALDFKKSL